MADRKDALLGHIRALTDEVRANRKLQYGLLAIAAIIVVELGLDWSDAISARGHSYRTNYGKSVGYGFYGLLRNCVTPIAPEVHNFIGLSQLS